MKISDMAIYFETKEPKKLLETFKELIDKKKVVTWSYDNDNDFTHAVPQWRFKAWLRPKIFPEKLALYVLTPKNTKMNVETYAIYHGRFLESMLAHCDSMFATAKISSMPEGDDTVASA